MQKRQIPEKGFASIKNDITGSELASGIVDTLQKAQHQERNPGAQPDIQYAETGKAPGQDFNRQDRAGFRFSRLSIPSRLFDCCHQDPEKLP